MKSETSHFVRVSDSPQGLLTGKYLQGPRTAKLVARLGYGFTDDSAEAWPFPSEARAAEKLRIVDRHMGNCMQMEVVA